MIEPRSGSLPYLILRELHYAGTLGAFSERRARYTPRRSRITPYFSLRLRPVRRRGSLICIGNKASYAAVTLNERRDLTRETPTPCPPPPPSRLVTRTRSVYRESRARETLRESILSRENESERGSTFLVELASLS